jgi:hypothetical protein
MGVLRCGGGGGVVLVELVEVSCEGEAYLQQRRRLQHSFQEEERLLRRRLHAVHAIVVASLAVKHPMEIEN